MIILENTFLKSQIYDKLVTMWLSYHFFVMKELFQLLPMQAFQDNENNFFLKISTPLVKNWSFCNKKLFFSIFRMSTALPHIFEYVHIQTKQISDLFCDKDSSNKLGFMKTKIHVDGPQKAMFPISNSHKGS